MGKSTISMVIFNSYFDITRGYCILFLNFRLLRGEKRGHGGIFQRSYAKRKVCKMDGLASMSFQDMLGDLVGDFIYLFMFKHSFGMIPDDQKIMGLESEPATWLQVSLVWALRCDSFLGRIAVLGGGYAQQSC